MIPKGICKLCGEIHFGQALRDPKSRICRLCGGGLEVKLYFRQGEVYHAKR